ncbi:hypothetical protein POTOM_038424 [Populus tomentosa]|uniref:Uncharacterized protein n=1 Tax=Populus tomentosa TaxID=118781 RepID=A0A8X8CL16_POPTO|nr:hypothetical protein POTOM_038424 [Populus tomentosa]
MQATDISFNIKQLFIPPTAPRSQPSSTAQLHLSSVPTLHQQQYVVIDVHPNRLESLRISMRKAGDEVKGASLASDAFFIIAWNDTVEKECELSIGVVAEHGAEGLVDSAATVTTTPWFVPGGTKEKFDGNGSDAIGIKGHSSAPVDIGGHKSDVIDIDKDLVGDEKDIEIAAVMVWFLIKKIP